MESSEKDSLLRAGKIAAEAVVFARGIVKKDMLLVELADKIEKKIFELGGKPAFPVNLSINEIAAHATPSHDEVGRVHGLLKVDLGVHVDGWIADTAFSVDLEDNEINRHLIGAAENALNAALKIVKHGVGLHTIGKVIEKEIEREGFAPVRNLSGHSLAHYDVHAGVTIPNYDNGDLTELEAGAYAIEPFATNGGGKVIDGKLSGIYQLTRGGNVRDRMAREVLDFISEEYRTLPFCSRWIHAKFGGRGLLGLKFIEQAGLLHHFAHLVESSDGIVAQAEHSFIIEKKDVKITT